MVWRTLVCLSQSLWMQADFVSTPVWAALTNHPTWEGAGTKVLPSHSVVSWLFATPQTVAPPGSSVREILQARILEWVVISSSIKKLLWVFLKHLMKSSESTFFWPTPYRSWILGLSCPEAQTLLPVVLWGGLQLSHPPAVEGSTPLSPRPLLPSLLKSTGSFLLKVFLETTICLLNLLCLWHYDSFCIYEMIFKNEDWVFIISIHHFIWWMPVTQVCAGMDVTSGFYRTEHKCLQSMEGVDQLSRAEGGINQYACVLLLTSSGHLVTKLAESVHIHPRWVLRVCAVTCFIKKKLYKVFL